ncbi:MAG: MFS transporter [Chloroflexota bacterium]
MSKLAGNGFVGYQWVILAVAVGAQAGTGASTQAVPVLAFFYQADLRLTLAEVGLLTAAISAATLFCGVASGLVTDRVGVRRMLLTGQVLSGCSIMALSAAPSFAFMLPLGFLAGVGTSLTSPAIGKSILYWFPLKSRATAMGIKQTGIPLCGALAAAILPPLALAFDWRSAMMFLGVAVVVSGVASFAFYRDSGSIVPQGSRKGPSLAGLKGVLLGKGNWLVAFLALMLVGSQFAVVTYLILYLKEVLLLSAAVAGGYLALVQMSGLGARIGWGFISDFVLKGRRKPVLLSCGFIATTMLALIGMSGADANPAVLVILMVGLGVSLIGWHGIWITVLTELNSVEMAGTAMGFGATITHIGAVGFPVLFGFIVDATGAYCLAWYTLAGLILLGTLPLLFLLHERIEHS